MYFGVFWRRGGYVLSSCRATKTESLAGSQFGHCPSAETAGVRERRATASCPTERVGLMMAVFWVFERETGRSPFR